MYFSRDVFILEIFIYYINELLITYNLIFQMATLNDKFLRDLAELSDEEEESK